MKHNTLKSLVFISLFLLVGQTTFAQWQKVNDIDSFPRSSETIFVIRDTAYLGNGEVGVSQYTSDFRGYTQNSNAWVKEPACPGGGGDQGFNFVINDTAYVGDGKNSSYLNNFWAYNPSTGWRNKIDAPGDPRAYCVGFTIGNSGYFGMGSLNGTPQSDFYEYDPSINLWMPKKSFPSQRYGCAAFSANGKGYIGLGGNGTGETFRDMYRYDPTTDKWDTMSSMPSDTGMTEPAYFVLCGKLIVTLGDTVQSGTHTTRQTWMFNPSNGPKGKWTRLEDFPGALPAYSAQGWTMGDTGFVYGGYDAVDNNYYRQDMYRYLPSADMLALSVIATPVDTGICSGAQVKLSVSRATTYLWSTHDTTSSIIVVPTTTTSYTVRASNGACFSVDTFNITVNNSSLFNIQPQSPVLCNGQAVTLAINGNGTNFTWSPSAGLSAISGDTVTASPAVTTTYTVTSAGGNCSFTDTVVVRVGNTAIGGIVSAVADTICYNTAGNLTLSGNSSNTIQWELSTDDTNFTNATGETTAKYNTPPLQQSTWYRAMVGMGNCSAISDTLQLYVFPALIASFNFTQTAPNQLAFNSDSSLGEIRSYHWDFGDNSTSNDKNPSHTYTKDTTYHICLTLYDGSNCSYTLCRYSSITDAVPVISALSNWGIYPNPFTNLITISAKETNSHIRSIEMYDVLGRLVIKKNTDNAINTSLELDVSALVNGMYYVMIRTADAGYMQKVVKQ